jgi:hypothetical protein
MLVRKQPLTTTPVTVDGRQMTEDGELRCLALSDSRARAHEQQDSPTESRGSKMKPRVNPEIPDNPL